MLVIKYPVEFTMVTRHFLFISKENRDNDINKFYLKKPQLSKWVIFCDCYNLKLVIERDLIHMIRMMRTMKKKKEEEKIRVKYGF